MQVTGIKKDILNLLAKGKRDRGISEELKISKGSVRLHIRELKLLFTADTTPELVYKASKDGVI